LDVIVTPADEHGEEWYLADLLGRSMGRVEKVGNGFLILAAGKAIERMAKLHPGPYPSLDDALAAIETHTRGTCRRAG
jgi:hypothetical protein